MPLFTADKEQMLFDVTPVPNQFLLEYMPGAKAEYVRVYLYGLAYSRYAAQEVTLESMAQDLGVEPEEIDRAMRYWERKHLVVRLSDNPLTYQYQNFVQAVYLNADKGVDASYLSFRDDVFAVFDENFQNEGYIRDFYEWEKDLGIPRPVVIALLQWIRDKHYKPTGKFPKKRSEAWAVRLAEEEAATPEEALRILATDEAMAKGARAIARKLGIRGREATDGELKLYTKWTQDWGFTHEAIAAVCDRETTKTSTPSFAYLDSVLDHLRGGQSGVTQQQAEERLDAAQPLRELLRVMNIRGVTLNEGTKEVYADLRRIYDDDNIILLAGKTCAKRKSASLTDVQDLLEHWRSVGARTQAEIEALLAWEEAHDPILRKLYRLWGEKRKPGDMDRELLRRWMEEWHCSEALILCCAQWAKDAERPMQYLSKTLQKSIEGGITTPEQAEQAHAAHVAQKGGGPNGPKSAAALRYDQRPAPTEDILPDWVLERLKEEADAK